MLPTITFLHLVIYNIISELNASNIYVTKQKLATILSLPSLKIDRLLAESLVRGLIKRDGKKGYAFNRNFSYSVNWEAVTSREIVKADLHYSVMLRALKEKARDDGTTLRTAVRDWYKAQTGDDLCD